MEAGGELGPSVGQRFCYVLEGCVDGLEAGGYGFYSSGELIVARVASRVMVIEKAGETGCPTFRSTAADVPSGALAGDSGVQVQVLLADDLNLNFAVNLMTFQPGASLSLVEMHVMEHGLMMLEGGGIYRLSDCWYPVSAGDFIWMAPFCPQWFGAVGKTPAKYIIYKDWNRHPGA
jgi:(S)-ureidoglycine aminohydrolase